jgi:tRNA-Thr(GGU) m(6)t(6)A37 methyltransferase TsaA
MERVYSLHPIGIIRKNEDTKEIRIYEEFSAGLSGLEGFSHIMVFFWFHKNDTPEKRKKLEVHPRGDIKNPLTGVFATRSPSRPNLIGLSTCSILSIKKNIISIDETDAMDATPVIDIKPYLPHLDSREPVRLPHWVKNRT